MGVRECPCFHPFHILFIYQKLYCVLSNISHIPQQAALVGGNQIESRGTHDRLVQVRRGQEPATQSDIASSAKHKINLLETCSFVIFDIIMKYVSQKSPEIVEGEQGR